MNTLIESPPNWPSLVSAIIFPWFTRLWTTYTMDVPEFSVQVALILTVEENIFNLLDSDSPSALLKGEALQEIWKMVLTDVKENRITVAEGLNKKYVVMGGSNLSFEEVASGKSLDLHSSVKEDRFSFFASRSCPSNSAPELAPAV